MRILSLLPSSTEIVFALGLGDQLVGVSHECDYPPEARQKPVVSTSILRSDQRSSDQIHDTIARTRHKGRSLYHIDANRLQQLDPDLILTQELCEQCAVSYNDVREAAKILSGDRKIVSFEPKRLEDVLENIRLIGELTDRPAQAHELAESLKRRIDSIRSKTRAVTQRPSVLCLEWLNPPMFAGHWVPDMVELAGGRDLWGQAGKPGQKIEWDDVLRGAPEVIVAMPCSFTIERTLKEIDRLTRVPGWETLPAIKNGRLFIVESRSYFSRHGPRVVTGLEILAQILHPEIIRGIIPEGAVKKLDAAQRAWKEYR